MDTLLYLRLSTHAPLVAIVGAQIQPVMPTTDSPTPYLYYWRFDTEDTVCMSGPVRPSRYIFAIDYWSQNARECRAIAEAVYARLSNWRDGDVQGAFRTSDNVMQDDPDAYHGQSVWSIWY